MIKRIFLFTLTNLLVVLTLGVLWALLSRSFGLEQWASERGINLTFYAVLALFWGFGGALISLLLSKTFAKMGAGVQVISSASASREERWLVETVHRLARAAGIEDMPEVGIYQSPEVNAFATGPSKNSALVAVSTGLLAGMEEGEIEGVLGHEVSHVANGDMVTLTLVQGVVNSFVIFLSFILSIVISNAMRSRDDDRGGGLGDFYFRHMLQNLLQMVFGLAAMLLVVFPFSRWREFRADQGGAEKAGKNKMIAALERLKDVYGKRNAVSAVAPALNAFKISGGAASLFSSHPPLQERIDRLRGN